METQTHLFLHHILHVHLNNGQIKEAVAFASHYQNPVFFAHALEILLHSVVEDDATLLRSAQADEDPAEGTTILVNTVDFLDHFDAALDVVVGCARKIEMARWPRLFDVVGNPKTLFEVSDSCILGRHLLILLVQYCLSAGRLKTAGSYLLVLHNLEQLDIGHGDSIRLLRSAMGAQDWQLCRELLRFLRSIDDSGHALRTAIKETGLIDLEDEPAATVNGTPH